VITRIYKNYTDFTNRENFEENGVSEDFAKHNPDFSADNETNIGCWNCIGCIDCSHCTDCENSKSCRHCKLCNNCSHCVRCEKMEGRQEHFKNKIFCKYVPDKEGVNSSVRTPEEIKHEEDVKRENDIQKSILEALEYETYKIRRIEVSAIELSNIPMSRPLSIDDARNIIRAIDKHRIEDLKFLCHYCG